MLIIATSATIATIGTLNNRETARPRSPHQAGRVLLFRATPARPRSTHQAGRVLPFRTLPAWWGGSLPDRCGFASKTLSFLSSHPKHLSCTHNGRAHHHLRNSMSVIHTYTRTQVHTCTHAHMHTYTLIHTHIHSYILIHTHTYILTYTQTHAYTPMHTHTHRYTPIHTHTHAHTHCYTTTQPHSHIGTVGWNRHCKCTVANTNWDSRMVSPL